MTANQDRTDTKATRSGGSLPRERQVMTVKVSVDNDRCEAHGQCNMIDEQIFTLDENGYSNIGKHKPIPDDLEDNADQGVYNCPVQALTLEES